MLNKTKVTKESEIKRTWHLFDANGKVLGRLSTQIAEILMGKNKPYYTSNLDCGDWVVVINAEQVAVTGAKETKKIYYHHSGYPGGLKETSLAEVRATHPERLIEHAVLGMLPKNKLRDQRMSRLKVFEDGNTKYKNQEFIIHN